MGRFTPYEVIAAADAPSHGQGGVSFCAFDRGAELSARSAAPCEHFIEFRVAENGVYGHSYVAYGCIERGGQLPTVQYADFHPIGGFASTVIGHFLPIAAVTEPTADTLQRRVTSAYRVALSAVEFQSVTRAIANLQCSGQRWSVLVYNCNDFLADLARVVGLRTPRTLMRPYRFVPALRRLNDPTAVASQDGDAHSRFPHTAPVR